MRMTALAIDQAGDVWAINNWKPRFDLDISPITGNPGGDGICIFIGLAKPPANGRWTATARMASRVGARDLAMIQDADPVSRRGEQNVIALVSGCRLIV